MSRSHLVGKLIAPLAASLFASLAFAHPSLVSSIPADKSQVAAPAVIELKFSEKLMLPFSAASLIMTGMPGMPNHGAMKVSASVAGASDGKSLVVTPAQALAPGFYRVEYRVVSSDTHPVSGSMTFQVK
ncbi:copper homeostasis periplasmic binding protein CopC [Accumulibacter sp.]|uniref:copper homeostasis periplasmic binding protein CopC n=1 Tax=Accumulibacter sp. TaxID=2053492 RepID=UPI00262177CA|nr:copper homeostasis periplasmic binding protein CopC [Accumulibacter sp.]